MVRWKVPDNYKIVEEGPRRRRAEVCIVSPQTPSHIRERDLDPSMRGDIVESIRDPGGLSCRVSAEEFAAIEVTGHVPSGAEKIGGRVCGFQSKSGSGRDDEESSEVDMSAIEPFLAADAKTSLIHI